MPITYRGFPNGTVVSSLRVSPHYKQMRLTLVWPKVFSKDMRSLLRTWRSMYVVPACGCIQYTMRKRGGWVGGTFRDAAGYV
jgi:hypothetical protein